MPSASDAQLQQAGLETVASQAASAALSDLDKINPSTIARMVQIYRALVAKYAPASAVLSLRQYMTQRLDDGIRDAFQPRAFTVPDAAPLRVEWSIAESIGPGGVDVDQVRQSLAASIAKTVHDSGRQTIIGNVKRDPAATAWARIPEPELTKTGTCSFCAMLASRGAVYKENTVGFLAHHAKPTGGHNCVCHAEPVFGKYNPSDLVKKYQQMWQDNVVAQNRRGADARAAFRQAVEGRDVTGLDKARSDAQTRPLKAATRGETAQFRSVSVTDDEARGIISNLEQSNARIGSQPQFAKLRAANDARIAQLRSQLGE